MSQKAEIWNKNLDDLCKKLADIYPHRSDINAMLTRIGLAPGLMALGDKSFNNWVSVLHEVLRLGLLMRLHEVADEDSMGLDEELRRLFELAQPSSITSTTLQEQFSRKTSFVPSLPYNFVPRSDVSDEMLSILLDQRRVSKMQNVPICVMHGLPGVGKSTLVADLMRRDEVERHFRDGIFRVTIGQKPDILSKLKSLLRDLNDNYEATAIETASNRLRDLLKNKKALIILDDVWLEDGGRVDDVKWFFVGGKDCHFLVTTRESKIANSLDATSYYLKEMTQEQALQLLSFTTDGKWSREEEEIAKELARKVGYLPLALQLAVAQVTHDGVTWQKLLEDLSEEIIDFKNWEELELYFGDSDEASLKDRSLLASFNLSLRRLLPAQRKMFALLGVLSADVVVSWKMIKTLWNVDEREAEKTLEYLARRALILQEDLESASRTYSLHSIQHAIARYLLTAPPTSERSRGFSGFGYKLTEVHEQLLNDYAKQRKNASWSTLPNDDYIYTHLTWHMEKAQKIDDIHALLAEEIDGKNAWYQVRESQGQVSEYLEDIFRAWRLAEDKLQEESKEKALTREDLILGIRYALVVSSLNSLAQNIPPTLLAMLVKQVGWNDIRALGYALRIPDKTQRTHALLKLLPFLKELPRDKAISNLFNLIDTIEDISERLEIMSELTLKLADLNLADEALSLVSIIKELSKNDRKQAELLAELAPKLAATGNVKELQERIEAINNPKDKGIAYRGLLPLLSRLEKENVSLAAFDANLKLKNDWEAILLGIKIFPYLAQNTKAAKLKKLLEGIEKIDHGKDQATVVRELLTSPTIYKSESLSERIASLARKRAARGTDEDRRWGAHILATLAHYLTEDKKEELLLDALRDIVEHISTITLRTDAFTDVVEALPRNISKNTRDFILYILELIKDADKILYRKALLRTAYSLPIIAKEEQANALKELQDMQQDYVLLDVSPYLSQPLKDQLLSFVAKRGQQTLYFRLSLRMNVDENKLIDYIDQIDDIEERINAFVDLMSSIERRDETRIDRDLIDYMLGSLLIDIHKCERKRRAGLIDMLASYMSRDQIENAFNTLHVVEDDGDRDVSSGATPWNALHAQQLEALTSFFTEEQDFVQAKLLDQEAAFQEIVGSTEIDEETWLKNVEKLTSSLLKNADARGAIDANWSFSEPKRRSKLFSDLARTFMERGYIHETFIAIQGIHHSAIRNMLLRRLISNLSQALQSDTAQEAMSALWMIEDRQVQEELLLQLAPYMPEHECLIALIWLIRRDGEHLLDRVLAIVQGKTDERWRIQLLAGLAPYLLAIDESLFLARLRALEDKRYLVQVLLELLPSLPQEYKTLLIEEIFDALEEVDDSIWQVQMLIGLVSSTPKSAQNFFIQQAISRMRMIDNKACRSTLFFKLVDSIEGSVKDARKEGTEGAITFTSKHFGILRSLLSQLSEVVNETILEEVLHIQAEDEDITSYTYLLIELLLSCPAEIQQDAMIEEFLVAAKNVNSENFFVWMLRRLFLLISDLQRAYVLEKLLAMAKEMKTKGWIYHAQIFVELLPFVEDEERRAIIESIDIINGSNNQKIQILVKLSPYVQSSFAYIQQAFDIASVAEMMVWCEAINELMVRLPETEREELADNVLLIIEKIQRKMDIFQLVKALSRLIPYFPATKKEQAVNYALGLARRITRDKGKQAIALSSLLNYLPHAQKEIEIPYLLSVLKERADIGSKMQALLLLLPHLSMLQQMEESEKAIQALKRVDDHIGRNVVFQLEFAEYVSPEKKEAAIADALHLFLKNAKETMSAEKLRELRELGYFELLIDATDRLEHITITQRAEILLDLVQASSDDHKEQAVERALATIEKISNAVKWASFLLRLMPSLPYPFTCITDEQMQKTVQSCPITDRREIVLKHLIQQGYIKQAISAASAIIAREERAEIIIALLPHLPESAQKKAMTHEAQLIVQAVTDEARRTEMLAKLAVHTADDIQRKVMVYEAFVAARGMQDPIKQTQIFVALLPHLSTMLRRVMIEQVLTNVGCIEGKTHIEEVMQPLIKWLVASGHIQNELSAVHSIGLTTASAGLVADLPEVNWSPLLLAGLRYARKITVSTKRRDVFSSLALLLKDLPRGILYPLWSEMLYAMKEYTRQDLIFDMYALLPIVASSDERALPSQIEQSILDVKRWWP